MKRSVTARWLLHAGGEPNLQSDDLHGRSTKYRERRRFVTITSSRWSIAGKDNSLSSLQLGRLSRRGARIYLLPTWLSEDVDCWAMKQLNQPYNSNNNREENLERNETERWGWEWGWTRKRKNKDRALTRGINGAIGDETTEDSVAGAHCLLCVARVESNRGGRVHDNKVIAERVMTAT